MRSWQRRRTNWVRRPTVAILVTVAVLAGMALPAYAAPAWSIVSSPTPAGPPFARLADVSCTATTNCVAVGSFLTPSRAGQTWIQRWNGSAWTTQPSPSPSADGAVSLDGVSCVSTTSCFAVGSFTNQAVTHTLVERWNGSNWSIVASPDAGSDTNSSLTGVSCVGAASCFAVGASTGSSSDVHTLVERWNGTAWSIVASPNRPGAILNNLSDVACATATSCFAIGYSTDTAQRTLVERWNGTAWSIVASPNPASGGASLTGISCVSTASCVAVGASYPKTFIERWNGTAWSIVASPNPLGSLSATLVGVSCVTVSSCFAVGNFEQTDQPRRSLAERWDGTKWSTVATPNRADAVASWLTSVSCTSATSCSAVGRDGDPAAGYQTLPARFLGEHWNGTAWSIDATNSPAGPPDAALRGVSCADATHCIAVGSFVGGNGHSVALSEVWDGTAWSKVLPAAPAGLNDLSLNGAACPTTTYCFAVGHTQNASEGPMLVERWNGTAWSIVATPKPAGGGVLSAVSCTSTTSCFAVGYTVPGNLQTLVARWNGTSWSVVPSPNPPNSDSVLSDVSCVSTTSCFAVGSSATGGRGAALIEQWNGTAWSIVATPPGTGGALNGVSCIGTTNCWAVADVIEHWNGTSWSIVPEPAVDGGLSGVSCTSATHCVAVGAQGSATLTEQWNGAIWSVVASPNRADLPASTLRDVSCTSTTSCFAVGEAFNLYGGVSPVLEVPLIERYS